MTETMEIGEELTVWQKMAELEQLKVRPSALQRSLVVVFLILGETHSQPLTTSATITYFVALE